MRDYDETEWIPRKPPKNVSPLESVAVVVAILFAFLWGVLVGIAGK